MRYDVTGFENGVKNEMGGIFLDGEHYPLNASSLNKRAATAMQFTGICDKNGKEIYEGDILAWHDNEVENVGQVCFADGFFNMHASIDTEDLGMIGSDPLRGEVKIIGNVHQNPELLMTV